MLDAHAIKELVKQAIGGKFPIEDVGLGDKLYRIVLDGSEERMRLAVNATIPGWHGLVVFSLRNGQPHKWGAPSQWFWLYEPDRGLDHVLDHVKEWIYALE